MKREGELACYFGTMKKTVGDGGIGTVFTVKPNVIKRFLCKTNWWEDGKNRSFRGDREFKPTDMTYPLGYDLMLQDL